MKTNIVLIFILIALAGFGFSTFAQNNKIPPPDKDIAFDKGPEVIKQVQPVYPASMLEGGWEATVYVKAFITTDGVVADARGEKIQLKVIRTVENDASPQERQTDGKDFEKSALAAVRQWKFTPAQMQGKSVAVWITIPFKFKLSGEGKKTSTKDSDDAAMEKRIESIKAMIENILNGNDLEKAKKDVGKEAILIHNSKIENLYSVINGEHKDIHLIEGKETQPAFFNIKINDGEDMAIITWKSELPKGKNKRVHSIILSKNAAKDWQISHWHVSF